MPIAVTCQCGNSFSVGDQHAGRRFKCPACGAVATAPGGPTAAPAQSPPPDDLGALSYAAPPQAAGLQYQSAPTGGVRLPSAVDEKFRQPGLPPVYLVFITEGTEVQCGFDASPALQTFANRFGRIMKKRFDVQLMPPPGPGVPAAFVRVILMDEGNRFLRYFLGIFFGATRFEVEGTVVGPAGQTKPFHFKHRGRAGMFGGGSLNLLKNGGAFLGQKVAKSLLKA